MELGRLAAVPLREIWPHEAKDFTPWLARPENLSFLAETLRLSGLELQDTEVPVGDFQIDILARDATDGRVVVVENQIDRTDHTHLGQILTYVAGQEGQAIVVWIAERVRDEHRAAIDWLNANTVAGFDFFAIRIEAVRIGSSQPAPLFNIVAQPNDWSRNIARSTAVAGTPDTDRQKALRAYWTRFGAFLQERNAPFKVSDPVPRDYWCGFGIGRPGFRLGAMVLNKDPKRSVAISISGNTATQAYDKLLAERNAIEVEYGGLLEWEPQPKIYYIRTNRPDLAEQDELHQFEWFLEQMERLRKSLQHRIKALGLDDITEPATLLESSEPTADPPEASEL